ncbi:MAG: glycogen synthase GlgA [Burkholderiales bacterium]|nr:glycogen synthase GlgA [Ferrovum sp.]
MKILFVTSEVHPLIKTGGLGDVSRSLPWALHRLGLDIRILVPGYTAVLAKLPQAKLCCPVALPMRDAKPARLLQAQLPGTDVPVLILDCPELYDRPGSPYQAPDGHDWPDNALRFGFLCQVGAWLCHPQSALNWHPDIVHCNDWQSALIPALLRHQVNPVTRSVMTIHNLAFQGNFEPQWVTRLGLPMESFNMHGLEFYGRFSFLKAGLNYADKITTVSNSYASEIQTPAFGCGMEGLIQHRRTDLTGIVNGIDEEWNPARDPTLTAPYDASHLAAKARNKRTLQRESGLTRDPAILLIGLVSRLTHQKGIDILLECMEALTQCPVQMVILGSGEAAIEQRLKYWAERYPERVSVTLAFDEALSHRIMAGCDLFLMPSRFEPCGLSQMYAMTYGAPPLVHRTGGLADTVTDCTAQTLANKTATGFSFDELTPELLLTTILRAIAYHEQKKEWRSLQRNGMRQDFSWGKAAEQYASVYRTLVDES